MSETIRVLFVDDDKDFLMAQKAFFGARGYEVHTAESTDQALSQLATLSPSIVVLDLMMEHYDSGFTLAHQIRKDPRFEKLPIVMLSGVAATTGQRFEQEGQSLQNWSRLNVFLDKPITGKQLLRVIEDQLGVQSAG